MLLIATKLNRHIDYGVRTVYNIGKGIIHGATIGVINPDNEMITGAF